ncbi:hypothetical protein [Nonomuraea candida]|uniref:hypothetical protein n=1 Tax=Nonomuraea candida TaxID=359159 RepID=UPI000A618A7E|nr:hypothetical protein [Nonomuraea candida]
MQRKIAVAVVAAMSVSITGLMAATPAGAAPADPVKVLQGTLKPGKGVRFSDVTSLVADSETTTFLRRTGKWQFGKKGIAASDITADAKRYSGGVFNRLYAVDGGRTIWIGGKSWTSHRTDVYTPEDGKFTKEPLGSTGAYTGTYGQLVNPAEPATLKVLLKGEKKGRMYSGKIGYATLAKVSPWFRASLPFGGDADTILTYELTLGADNLPHKLVTSRQAVDNVPTDGRFKTVTSYTGWGSKVSVAPPPKDRMR